MSTLKDFFNQKIGFKQIAISLAIIILPIFLLLALIDKVLMPMYVHSIEVVRVPSIVGMTLNNAERVINNSGLRIAEVRDAYSEKVPKGKIISQLPFGNSEVRKGRRLYIIVSNGIEKVIVPNLQGKTEREARLQLMSMGFQTGAITEIENEEIPKGLVISQSINPGLRIPYGKTISFEISKGSGEIEVPELYGKTIDEARSILFSLGLVLAEPLYTSDAGGTHLPGTIIRQDIQAGDLLQEGDFITVTVSR